jgi:TM2 domain-containing membrane protein YozV
MRTEQEKYCFNCGQVIDSRAAICPKCGVPQPDAISNNNKSLNTRWLITLLLCVFLGTFGIHRFYLGRITTGILMLITFGGLGIWYLIDLIIVITGGMKDQYGDYVKPNIG